MANEFYRYFGADIGISLTPGANGRLEVYLDGEKIFDRSEEDGKYPDLTRVKQLRGRHWGKDRVSRCCRLPSCTV